MRFLREHRRLAAWIAVLAILLTALAPSVSRALGVYESGHWAEICTAQGSKWVESDSNESRSVPAAAHLLEHCPYCSLHMPALGMPPAAGAAPLSLELNNDFQPAMLAAPPTLHAWVSAQPRAPPRFS